MNVAAGSADTPRTPAASLRSPTVPDDLSRYSIGVVITVFVILSQYFLPQTFPALDVLYGNLLGDLFVVYGIPVLAFAYLIGGRPLRQWAANLGTATWEGLQWIGLTSLLALFVVIVLEAIYAIVDPAALQLLERTNPALQQAASSPWFYIGLSFVVGAFEETIFRGWIFGYWLQRPNASWLVAAIWTSVLFAGVHLYYGTTYGAAYPILFVPLFFLGFSFAATVKYSGGNLVVVALLHGGYDAISFAYLLNPTLSDTLHVLLIVVGLVVALVLYVRSRSARPPPVELPAAGGVTPPADPYAWRTSPDPFPPGAPPPPGHPPPGR
ncbi:MAG: type II CAAX endopeptidase family protein [Thermoplasmata archaeon]